MSSTTIQAQTRQSTQRGKRGNRGRRGGSFRTTRGNGDKTAPSNSVEEVSQATEEKALVITEATTEGENVAICWICAEPVKYYSVSACNHRTCHVCALRLRALYKKLECTFCKEPQPTVIFTSSPDAQFSSYTPDVIPHKDSKLSIYFETADMMEETLILLRFNCPDSECDYIASGWGDLKLHVRGVHGKLLCELCIRFKKVFAHEHALYPPNVLPLHLPSMPHRTHKQPNKEVIEGGIHPLCAFCRECFFSDDELFVHMRERHEECFICKRNEIRDQYFQNYESLEQHFTQAHFACTNPTCQAQKFVVFGSALDLKAHQVEAHGTEMTARDRKDARRVQADFEFDGGGGIGRRGRRDRGDREREREPPPVQDMAAPIPQRTRRREAFGGHLTTEATTSQTLQPSGDSHLVTPSPPNEDLDPIIVERYTAFIARLQSIAPNAGSASAAVKAAIRGYRANETSARDLISTVWHILDNDLDNTASIINGIVDLLDEEEKKRDLLASWNDFKIEKRQQYPDLIPSAVGSGYAGVASGRVLNAKHATAMHSSQQSSRQVWDRVAQAASSSSSRPVPGAALPATSRSTERFPPLAGPSATPFRQPQRNTPWTSSSSASGVRPPPSSVPAPALKTQVTTEMRKAKPPSLSAALFPELPTSASTRIKPPIGGNQSLRKIIGNSTPASSAWGAAGGSSGVVEDSAAATGGETIQNEAAKGKKGKGKQKQTLFTISSFPT